MQPSVATNNDIQSIETDPYVCGRQVVIEQPAMKQPQLTFRGKTESNWGRMNGLAKGFFAMLYGSGCGSLVLFVSLFTSVRYYLIPVAFIAVPAGGNSHGCSARQGDIPLKSTAECKQ